MSITKFNKTNKVTFDVDLKSIDNWCKAKDCVGKTITIKAIGWHPSSNARYGDSVFAIASENYGINLPSWFKDTVVDVLADEESVEQIKRGEVAIKFTSYTTKSGTETVNCTFIEIPASISSSELPY